MRPSRSVLKFFEPGVSKGSWENGVLGEQDLLAPGISCPMGKNQAESNEVMALGTEIPPLLKHKSRVRE